MGTRGALGFKCGGEYKLTYNHYDSYPSYLGEKVVEFVDKVEKEEGWEKLDKACKKLKLVDDQSKPSAYAKKKYAEFKDESVQGGEDNWYVLLRKLQGEETLDKVYEGKLTHLIDSTEFVYDSLFCEYAYAINLDDHTIEFYDGFQTKPQKGNPFGERSKHTSYDGTKYYPTKLVGKVPLGGIPEKWMAKFYPFSWDVEEPDAAAAIDCKDGNPIFTTFEDTKKKERVNTLHLDGCEIDEIPPVVSRFESLYQLNANNNNIKKIGNLDNAKNLKWLSLKDNNIKSMSGLSKLKDLEELNLEGNKIKVIKGVNRLKKLQGINLSNNQIEEIPYLERSKRLTNISLANNKIKDISGISLTRATEIDLSGNEIKEIKGIPYAAEALALHDNKISSMNKIKDYPNLKLVTMYGNDVSEEECKKFREKQEGIAIICSKDEFDKLEEIGAGSEEELLEKFKELVE